jgi:glycosyltransferase involved in cell wall biosynthesis
MKVLIIARGYPTEKYKMNGIFEFDQAKALADAGVEVLYASIDIRSIRRWRKWGFEYKLISGVQVFSFNVPLGGLPKRVLNKFRNIVLNHLYGKIERAVGKPDVIHAHFIQNGYILAKSFYDKEIPLIITEHYSAMNQKKISPYLYNIGKFTYERMNKVICVSEALASNIRINFNINVEVIPNMVYFREYEQRNVNKIRYNFISTGRLVKSKGMDFLIEAFSTAFRNDINVSLYIFGDGPEYKNLRNIIKMLGMNEQIKLMGLVNRSEIYETMQISDCFVLVSEHETFGVSYIEALAAGLPVIATKCGGPEDFINRYNGKFVEIGNKSDLVNSMKFMYKNSKIMFDRNKIKKETIEKFSSDKIALRLISLYKELLK